MSKGLQTLEGLPNTASVPQIQELILDVDVCVCTHLYTDISVF